MRTDFPAFAIRAAERQRIEGELAELEARIARPDAWNGPDASALLARYESLHVALGGAETQAFLRLLRWAESNGRIERIGS